MAAASEHEMADLLEMLENTRDDKSRLRFVKAWLVVCKPWQSRNDAQSKPACRLSDHKLNCEQAVAILKQLFGLGDVAIQAAKVCVPPAARISHATGFCRSSTRSWWMPSASQALFCLTDFNMMTRELMQQKRSGCSQAC